MGYTERGKQKKLHHSVLVGVPSTHSRIFGSKPKSLGPDSNKVVYRSISLQNAAAQSVVLSGG